MESNSEITKLVPNGGTKYTYYQRNRRSTKWQRIKEV